MLDVRLFVFGLEMLRVVRSSKRFRSLRCLKGFLFWGGGFVLMESGRGRVRDWVWSRE